jgi:hypothetical protein
MFMNYKDQSGFSLIDLVIGTTILAFTLTGIMMVIGDMSVKSVRNESIEKATVYGTTVINNIRAHRFDENYGGSGWPWTYPLGSDGGDLDDIDDYIGADWSGIPGYASAGYTATSMVHYIDPPDLLSVRNYVTNYKRIVVVVTHPDLANPVFLSTIMTPHGNY